MKKIVLNSPSTFFCTEPNLRVYDDKKKIFYCHPNKEKLITFNLPKGVYFSPNNFKKEPIFKPYKTFEPFLKKGTIEKIKLEEKNNPNKATIYRSQKRIVIDPKFSKHEFKPVVVFCLAHELHHFKYFPKSLFERMDERSMIEIEKQCDEGAVNYMLATGYNPTQIKLAKNIILSNKERGLCVDHLTIHPKNNFRR